MSELDVLPIGDELTCAVEAIEAYGVGGKIDLWYRRWLPGRYENWGPVTSAHPAASCQLMDDAADLLRKGELPYSPTTDAAKTDARRRGLQAHFGFHLPERHPDCSICQEVLDDRCDSAAAGSM